jgi:probable DNA metabolism protein
VAQDGSGGSLLGAVIRPTYNVLSLLAPHFARRFPGERFLIADAGRGTGVFFDGAAHEVRIDARTLSQHDPFEELWRAYHKSIAIAERKNPRLQRQFLPQKYWEYLPEMRENLKHRQPCSKQFRAH